MKYNFNPQQEQAIYLSGQNILVSAAAGSGKTTVLIERIFEHISGANPIDIDRLLVLTFTNAAAAQMRQRLEIRLNLALNTDPGNQHLRKQLALLPQASITTIHSFCLNTIRKYFYALPIDAGFRIATQTERQILGEDVLADFMEQQYELGGDDLAALADLYGGNRDDRELLRLITDLHQFSLSQANPSDWLKKSVADFGNAKTIDDFCWSPFLAQMIGEDLALIGTNLQKAHAFGENNDIPLKWLKTLEAELADWQQLKPQQQSLSQILASLANQQFGRMSAAKDGDELAKATFKELRQAAIKPWQELIKQYCQRDYQLLLDDMAAINPLLQRLQLLVDGYQQALSEQKRKRNLIDFSDMEHLCLALLADTNNGIAAELSQNFAEVLIDEYQDINLIQETILSLLQNGHNLFAVGDVKQSIYRFRLAEPRLFLQKYQDYGLNLGGKAIELNYNYRSNQTIIEAVNFIFERLMSKDIAEIDYDFKARLQAGRDDGGEPAELWLIEKEEAQPEPATDDDGQEASNDQAEHHLSAEARFIGQRINQLMAAGQYQYQDIVILLRSPQHKEAIYIEELQKQNIPVIAAKHDDFLQSSEIKLVMALLAILDNPLRDIDLAAIMRSLWGNFSMDQIAALRLLNRELPLWLLLEDLVTNEPPADLAQELVAKCITFVDRIKKWRQQLKSQRISDFLAYIYEQGGLYQLVLALPLSSQRQENLEAFYHLALDYEEGNYQGLFRFLTFIEQNKNQNSRRLSGAANGRNAVQIMSIHQSKGLEFPIVFVANLAAKFSRRDEYRDILWHKDLGLAPKIIDRDKRIKFPSLAHDALRLALRKENLAEEMRILYVALTRAKEKLIICAALKDVPDKITACYNAIDSQAECLNAYSLGRETSPLNWLIEALLISPAARPFYQAANLKMPSFSREDDLLWQCRIVQAAKADDLVLASNQFSRQNLAQKLAARPINQQIEQVLGYKYPYQDIAEYPAKWSVTELNRLKHLPAGEILSEAAFWPNPGAKNQGSSLERGNIYHQIMQQIDLQALAQNQTLKQQIELLLANNLLTEQALRQIDLKKIEAFLQSPLAKRLLNSSKIWREQKFTYALPANSLITAAADDDILVLQGIVDLLFEENGKLIVIDYKSGGFGKSISQLQADYQNQIYYYSLALSDIFKQEVAEAYLVFLDLGLQITT